MYQLLLNENIYTEFVSKHIALSQRFVWIVTADIKDMYIQHGRHFIPMIELLAELVGQGVSVRLIHAKEPGPRFREDFDRFPQLLDNDLFERILCPRVHTKCIVIDGVLAFTGSANLTGAGLGAKHRDKRNFEAGFMFDDNEHIEQLMNWIDQLYLGEFCLRCKRRSICPDPIQ